ncbi:PEP-CTERM sorting domain-containing protein [Mucisphaera calidilacus]|nr:PEP-CTERM sorting domain-containing protein [Mucisphaera calidilacus]
MMRTCCTFTAASLLATTAATAQVGPGQPFIADDFESGLGSWGTEGGTAAVSITADAFNGAGALEVDYAADFDGARIDIPLDPSNIFAEMNLGFVYKAAVDSASALPGLRALVVEFSPSGLTFHNGDFLFASDTWQASPLQTINLARPDADALALIIQGHTNKPGSFIVDDLTLSNVPEPASAALLGLAGLIATRRR